MTYLLDTNVLLRLSRANHPMNQLAMDAVAKLRFQNQTLCLTRQNLIKLRNVATRPAQSNGFGLSAVDADNLFSQLEQNYAMLSDVDAIYFRWRALVAGFGVMGKQVHDTRLVAVMLTYGVTHMLTFNVQDFSRFQAPVTGLGTGIQVVHPQSV